MKNYHVIVNGSSAESQIQMEEALGFVKSNLQTDDIKPGNLYIYGKDGAPYTQEQVLAELEKEVQEEDLYVFGNGEENTAMAVRLAARCHGSSVTDVQAVESSWTDSGIAVRKMVYANHMEALFQMEKGLTVSRWHVEWSVKKKKWRPWKRKVLSAKERRVYCIPGVSSEGR